MCNCQNQPAEIAETLGRTVAKVGRMVKKAATITVNFRSDVSLPRVVRIPANLATDYGLSRDYSLSERSQEIPEPVVKFLKDHPQHRALIKSVTKPNEADGKAPKVPQAEVTNKAALTEGAADGKITGDAKAETPPKADSEINEADTDRSKVSTKGKPGRKPAAKPEVIGKKGSVS